MRIRLLIVAMALLGLWWTARPGGARAQSIRLDVEAAPLVEALAALREQTSLDLVYAQRLVEGRVTTCRYAGRDPEAALRCVLAETGLQAERVRSRQFVLRAVTVLSAGDVPAQLPRTNLAGFVVGAESGEVLPGAHIYLPELRLGTVTNEAGYFALPDLPQGPYHVNVSFLGYRSRDTVLVAGAAPVSVQLEDTALQANGVLVEADRASRAEIATVPGLVALPVDQLEALPSLPGEPDLFQALRWLPGVQKVGEVNGGLAVRGGQPDQNLYLLDGAPVYHPWHAFSLISTFQTETFKDIKLYRGSFPAEHGGRLSAVLEAEMKDGSQAGPRAVAAVSAVSGRFIIESPITEKSSFMLSGRRSYVDRLIGREHPVEEDGRFDTLRTGYYFYDASAKFTYRPTYRHRLSVSYYEGRDDLDLRLPFDLSLDFSSWLRPADLFFEVDHDWGNRLLSTRYQYLASRRFFVTVSAYHSAYSAREGAFIRPSDLSTVQSDYEVRLRNTGVKVDVDHYRSLEHQVQAGVHLVRHDFRSRIDAAVRRSPGSVDSLAQSRPSEAYEAVLYVQDTWQPSARWRIQPGLRLSFFSGGARTHLGPRLHARYAVRPERFFLKAAVGWQVQYLHRLRDRFSFLYDVVSSRWIPAGGDVEPSAGMQVAVGAESYPLSWLTLAADAYWSASDEVLLPQDEFQTKDGLEVSGIDLGTLLGQYTPGEARSYGFEATARAERGPWQLWLIYTGARSLSRAPARGEETFRPARFDVPHSLRGLVRRSAQRWAWTLSTEWRSGYPDTVPEARYALGDPLGEEPVRYLYRPSINNGRLPPYFRLDLTAGYQFKLLSTRARAQLHLYNVLSRRNVIGRQYDPAVEQGVLVKDRLGLPILPLLEFRIEL